MARSQMMPWRPCQSITEGSTEGKIWSDWCLEDIILATVQRLDGEGTERQEEIEKLAGRVIMKMNLKKEVREMGESRPCTGTRVGSDSPQRQSI